MAFPAAAVHHLKLWAYDHRPLLYTDKWDMLDPPRTSRNPRRFVIEEAWSEEEECKSINNSWGLNLHSALKKYACSLSTQGIGKFHEISTAIAKHKNILETLNSTSSPTDILTICRAEQSLNALLEKGNSY